MHSLFYSVFYLRVSGKLHSYVESEENDIAVLHYVILALETDESLLLCSSH